MSCVRRTRPPRLPARLRAAPCRERPARLGSQYLCSTRAGLVRVGGKGRLYVVSSTQRTPSERSALAGRGKPQAPCPPRTMAELVDKEWSVVVSRVPAVRRCCTCVGSRESALGVAQCGAGGVGRCMKAAKRHAMACAADGPGVLRVPFGRSACGGCVPPPAARALALCFFGAPRLCFHPICEGGDSRARARLGAWILGLGSGRMCAGVLPSSQVKRDSGDLAYCQYTPGPQNADR